MFTLWLLTLHAWESGPNLSKPLAELTFVRIPDMLDQSEPEHQLRRDTELTPLLHVLTVLGLHLLSD